MEEPVADVSELKEGDRVKVWIYGDKKHSELTKWYPGTVKINDDGKLQIEFDDGEVYPIDDDLQQRANDECVVRIVSDDEGSEYGEEEHGVASDESEDDETPEDEDDEEYVGEEGEGEEGEEDEDDEELKDGEEDEEGEAAAPAGPPQSAKAKGKAKASGGSSGSSGSSGDVGPGFKWAATNKERAPQVARFADDLAQAGTVLQAHHAYLLQLDGVDKEQIDVLLAIVGAIRVNASENQKLSKQMAKEE